MEIKSGFYGRKEKNYENPFVPKYANYDYAKVYDGNDRFIGWIRIYYKLAKAVE